LTGTKGRFAAISYIEWQGKRMRMKRATIPGLALLILLSMTGCAQTYWIDRGRDSLDIVTATVGMDFGARARVGPLHAGLFYGNDLAGLRGGEIRSYSAEDCENFAVTTVDYTFLSMEGFGFGMNRGKAYCAFGYPFVSTVLDPYSEEFPWPSTLYNQYGVFHPYYTQIDVAAGLLGGVRLGFNPGELLDFILGWTTLDFFKDDISAGKHESVNSIAISPIAGGQHELQMSLNDSFSVSENEKWNVTVERSLALRFADVLIEPKEGDAFSLKLFFKCDTPDLAFFDTPERMKEVVITSSEEYLPYSVEESVAVKELSAKGWYGFYAVLTDKELVNKKDIPPAEFKYLTRGMIRLSEDSALGFSLMTNELDTPEYMEMMDYILKFAKEKKPVAKPSE
jgi:hypothetical protein